MKTSNTIIAVMLAASPLLSACNPSFSLNPCDRELKPSQLYKQILPSVALINTGNGLGSAFIVKHENEKTYLLTNSHVAAGKIFLDVHWPDKTKETGKVVGDLMSEQESDMALIEVEGLRGKPLTIDNKLPEIGEDIIAVGAPQGLDFTMTRGIVSQLRKDNQIIQIDAPVNPGNSGGPLFTSGGCVSGMVTFKKEDSEGLNFAIAPSVLSGFLDSPTHKRFDDTALIKEAAPFMFDVKSVERLIIDERVITDLQDARRLFNKEFDWKQYKEETVSSSSKSERHGIRYQYWAPDSVKQINGWKFLLTRTKNPSYYHKNIQEILNFNGINCEEGLLVTSFDWIDGGPVFGIIYRKMGREWWNVNRNLHIMDVKKAMTGKSTSTSDPFLAGSIEKGPRESLQFYLDALESRHFEKRCQSRPNPAECISVAEKTFREGAEVSWDGVERAHEWAHEKDFKHINPIFNAVCKVNA